MSCSSINPVSTTATAVTTGATYSYPPDWATAYTPKSPNRECLPSGNPFPRTGTTVSVSDVNNHVQTLLAYKYPVNVPAVVNKGYSGISSIAASSPSLSNAANNFARDNINPAAAFAQAANQLRSNLQDEYCFYNNRYSRLLTFILTIASDPNGNVSDAQYQDAIVKANIVNNKLNDIIMILQALAKSRDTDLRDNYYDSLNGVNQVNSDLETARAQLESDIEKLNTSELQLDIQSAMMQYTIEKNQSSRNLLAIYGFMNIVAIGMLYYIYRNGK